jgi:ferredoxin
MVNENVPLTVIQELLDHGSIEMTARCARLRDETIKQAVKRWHERVNIRGERIALPTDGLLEQAAWMKERIARAKQALPNGYCGLPLVQSCPHPNACLSCESFLTDGSFRAVHEQQQAETRRLPEKARKQDNVRLIEVLERDEQSLTRILDGLDQIDADDAGGGGGEELATVTFAAVATRAGVSRVFLYEHAELRAQIEALRAAQAAAPARLPVRQRASDASLRSRLRAALDERQRQREEIAAPREELALALGRVREMELDRRVRRQ